MFEMDRIAYRVNEAAEVLGVGRSTIWKWLSEGRLTRHKIGGCTLIRADEIDALGKKHAQNTTPGSNETVSQNNDLTSSL